jgi:hypothetical protein
LPTVWWRDGDVLGQLHLGAQNVSKPRRELRITEDLALRVDALLEE